MSIARLIACLPALAGLGLAAVTALVGLATPAAAHPHVFVVVKTDLLFDPQGRVTGIRHAWTFDDMYSAFATTGLTSDGKPASPQKLQPLAEQNVNDLTEYGYFTVVRSPGQKVQYDKPTEISMSEDQKKLVTLRFTIPFKTPVSADKALTMQVYDPTYFVSFDFETKGVVMRGAPAGCSLNLVQPQPLAETETKRLNEAFFSGLSPGADFGIKMAGRAIVACP